MELSGVFRGADAVASGALTRRVLHGPRFRRLFPDVYAPAGLPVTLALRARAAALLVGGNGVLSGYSAAELLGASSGARDAPAEVTCPAGRHRLPGLLVHRDSVCADEVVRCSGLRMTSPVRTAYDLARWTGLTDAVAAVDALAFRFPFDLAELAELRNRHLGAHGNRRLDRVLALVDRRAESPMESRVRVALVLGGLPPRVQHPVLVVGTRFRLDLAYPDRLLAVEFDGAHHRSAEQARRDLWREAVLTGAGWKLLRFGAWTVLNRPDVVLAHTRAELARRVITVSAR